MNDSEYVDAALKGMGIDNKPSRIRDLALPGIRGAFGLGRPVEQVVKEMKPGLDKVAAKWRAACP